MTDQLKKLTLIDTLFITVISFTDLRVRSAQKGRKRSERSEEGKGDARAGLSRGGHPHCKGGNRLNKQEC